MKVIINIIILFFFSLLGLSVSFGQVKLTYSDIKIGKFHTIIDGEIGTYIKRTKNRQFEFGATDHVKIVLKITWENDSTYRLHFIRSNRIWTKTKTIKGNPDLIVKITVLNELSYLQESHFIDSKKVYKSEIRKIW